METLIVILIGGICTGGVYGLVASAFTFQVGQLRMTNLGYGSTIMLAMYMTAIVLKESGWIEMWYMVILYLLIYFVIFFILGFLIRKFLMQTTDNSVQVLITMGLSLIIQNFVLFVWGSFPRDLGLIELSIPITDSMRISGTRLIVLVAAALVLFGFSFYLKKTWTGRAIRAVVQQKEIAYLMGVDANKVINIAFGISYVILAFSALALSLMFTVEPNSGAYFQLLSFLICVMAGLGNMSGAFYAGLMVGVISAIINTYVSAQWHDPILFMLMVIVLTFLPRGIFASKKSKTRAV